MSLACINSINSSAAAKDRFLLGERSTAKTEQPRNWGRLGWAVGLSNGRPFHPSKYAYFACFLEQLEQQTYKSRAAGWERFFLWVFRSSGEQKIEASCLFCGAKYVNLVKMVCKHLCGRYSNGYGKRLALYVLKLFCWCGQGLKSIIAH